MKSIHQHEEDQWGSIILAIILKNKDISMPDTTQGRIILLQAVLSQAQKASTQEHVRGIQASIQKLIKDQPHDLIQRNMGLWGTIKSTLQYINAQNTKMYKQEISNAWDSIRATLSIISWDQDNPKEYDAPKMAPGKFSNYAQKEMDRVLE